MNRRLKLILVLIPFMALGACAKHIGNENVPRIAEGIFDTAETGAQAALAWLQWKAPEYVEPTMTDFEAIRIAAELYADGQLTGDKSAESVIALLNRINARLNLLGGIENDLAVIAINYLGRQFDRYVGMQELPPELGLYLEALGGGIQSGLDKYRELFLPHTESETLADPEAE